MPMLQSFGKGALMFWSIGLIFSAICLGLFGGITLASKPKNVDGSTDSVWTGVSVGALLLALVFVGLAVLAWRERNNRSAQTAAGVVGGVELAGDIINAV